MKYLLSFVYIAFLTAIPPAYCEVRPQFDSKLLEAVRQQNLDQTKLLIEKGENVSPDCLGANHKCKPISFAAELPSTQILKVLLIKGANANEAENPYGRRPLHYAVNANQEKNIRLLLTSGANPNHPNSFGISPFLEACFRGDERVVKMMLDDGIIKADVNQTFTQNTTSSNPSNISSLMQAAGRGHVLIVELLLARGADASAKDSWGMTAADYVNKFLKDEAQAAKLLKALTQNK